MRTAAASSCPRGYVTTPAELHRIAARAAAGVEPYKSAVRGIQNFANTGSGAAKRSAANPTYWPYGSITGKQECSATEEPRFLWGGSPLVEAKAFVYHLTGDARYAAEVRRHLLELATTYGYGGARFSGGNQCILNLSWYLPGWIIAADLLDGYPGWSAADKRAFQSWLADEVYKKTDWSSDRRSNNWGAAGSATSAMIADYLTGSGLLLTDRDGRKSPPAAAFAKHRQRQLDRLDGNSYMDNYNCHQPVGIRPDGGIPEELARGSSGCNALAIAQQDASWYYTQTYLQAVILHAELLLRRDDPSLYEHRGADGRGSILRAIRFVIANPRGSQPWRESAKQVLELAYRYYRDPAIAVQLRIGRPSRYLGRENRQMVHFGTLTHGFAPSEDPPAPPTVPAP